MIKLLRVDHRLLHGQVAFSWTNTIGADAILIANNEVTTNELLKTTMRLAKPVGVKLVMKNVKDSISALNSGVTDKYKLFIIVGSVEDAYKIIKSSIEITELDLGGTKPREGTRQISKAINLTEDEIKQLKELTDEGIDVYVQMIPTDSKESFKNIMNREEN